MAISPNPESAARATGTSGQSRLPADDEAGHEIEVKLDISSGEAYDALHRLADLSARYPMERGRTLQLADVYLDTTDFALLRHGVVLRLRQGGNGIVVTLKDLGVAGEQGLFERSEYEGPVQDEHRIYEPATWPEAVRVRVVSIIGRKSALVPIGRLLHEREVRDVYRSLTDAERDAPGAPDPLVGELVFERVHVGEPASPPDRRPRFLCEFAEVEFELRPAGSIADLEFIARWLQDRDGLSPAKTSKFVKAIRCIAAYPPGDAGETRGVLPAMRMAEAGRLIWRQQLVEILLQEAGARHGRDLEFVHRMRVATRRSRAAATLFGPYFDRQTVRPFLKDLRRTARVLGRVRDLDVALHKLSRHRRGTDGKHEVGLDQLSRAWKKQRRYRTRQLLEWLDSKQYRSFIIDYGQFCATPDAGALALEALPGSPVSDELRHVMPVSILERFATVRAYERVLDHDAPPATLHALRIDCKRLRYTLEAVRHLLGKDGAALIKQLKLLQNHLGDLNDADVARASLTRCEPSLLEQPGVAGYLQVQEDSIRRLSASFPEVWHTFIATGNRELLMRAVARL